MSDSQGSSDAIENVLDQNGGGDESDAWVSDFAKRFSRSEKRAELIAELRREVAASNDPTMRAALQELEAATNMTAARRVIGGFTMHVDPRYPAPDVYTQAIALISAVPPSAGYGVGPDSEREWKRTLDHYEWHGEKTFLRASIAHCRWFSGHLLGEPGREKDAFAFRNLGDQLSRLEKKEVARQHGRDTRQLVTKGAGRPPNKAVNGTVLRDFRLLFDLGKHSRIDFAKRVLKVKSPYAVKTAEAGSASEKIIEAYLVAESPTGKKLKREDIIKN